MNSLKDTGKKTREFSTDRHQQTSHNRHWHKETDLAKDIEKHFRKILAGRHVSSVQTDISRLRLTDLAEKKRKNQLKQILTDAAKETLGSSPEFSRTHQTDIDNRKNRGKQFRQETL